MAQQPRERTDVPGIYRRGSRYQVIYRDRYARQRSKMARSMAEARRLKAQLESDSRRGAVPDTTLTLGAYCTQWLEIYQGRTRKGVTESTLRNYEQRIRLYVLPFLGRVRLSALEPRDCKSFIADVRGKVSTSYAREILATLKLILRTAVEDGLISRNPSDSLVVSEKSTQRDINPSLTLAQSTIRKAMTQPEMKSILDAAGDDRLMFQFLYETGVRVAELVAVQYQGLDLDGRRLTVDRQLRRGRWSLPKGGTIRTVPLSTSLSTQLGKLRGEPADRVFPISDQTVLERLKGIREATGLDWVTPHSFRHTCATHLFQSGANVKQVQLWLGHADPAFTLRTYVHQFPDDLPEPDSLF